MRLKHKVPCSECPWRKTSVAGWLGGNTAELYADTVQTNEIPPCHNNTSAFCVGALATANNSCTLPHKTEGAIEAAKKIGQRKDCFKWVRDFFEHHTNGEEYTFPILRRRK